jgi:hypothetical protein
MVSAVMRTVLPRGLSLLRDSRAVLAVFALTLFLSAVLLFSLQPMFAKMVLPKLGGAPAVWAVSMCFFQAVLLAGYGYAHAVNRFLPMEKAPLAHLCVCLMALAALPFGLPAQAEPPTGDAYLWLLGTLARGVGLPFFAVAANAPLLQAWFARSGHPDAEDPYFLYAASNAGSLIALLAYPILLEPLLGLSAQTRAWTGGLVVLGILLGLCGAITLAAASRTGVARTPAPSRVPAAPITHGQRLVWIGLAFVPAGLLVAFTSYLTMDIASAPLLWVIPLALFLGTFILVFRQTPLISHALLTAVQPALVAILLFGLAMVSSTGWLVGITAGFAAFMVTTMVCHRELFNKRPAIPHLTEFYLWMSLGGVLGGAFAALLAPKLFNALYEFPLLLVLGVACRPGLPASFSDREAVVDAAGMAGAGLVLLLALAGCVWAGVIPASLVPTGVALLIFLAAGLTLAAHAKPLRQLLLVSMAGLALVLLPNGMNMGFSQRSFFGVHRIFEVGEGQARVLMHGTTVHGAQRLKDENGRRITHPLPATYYYPGSPMALGVAAARATAKGGHTLAIGIVGLGAGSMACYARTGEAWRFFEIDPVVVALASNPQLFSFIDRCQPAADVVLGDARLTLAKEPAGRFDYLLIDAFSSDSVPVHMLTREAVAMYLDKLAADGILALHLTNRHLNLVQVASAVARSIPGIHALIAQDRVATSLDHAQSKVMFITRSPTALTALEERVNLAAVAPAGDGVAWTDDYSDILSALWRNLQP